MFAQTQKIFPDYCPLHRRAHRIEIFYTLAYSHGEAHNPECHARQTKKKEAEKSRALKK